MRAVVQRVESAKVSVSDRSVSESEASCSQIGKGAVVFLGIEEGDGEPDAQYLVDKIVHLRIFEDESGKMNLSLLDVDGEMLVVSQFTLLGDCRNGRRPSFTQAEKPGLARPLYDYFLSLMKMKVRVAAEGEFQAMMKVHLVNDGPVTMLLDSKKLF
jgi:D-tyrosyl-tRNA(Tyr) deacylase